jgi:hypothetical protein
MNEKNMYFQNKGHIIFDKLKWVLQTVPSVIEVSKL